MRWAGGSVRGGTRFSLPFLPRCGNAREVISPRSLNSSGFAACGYVTFRVMRGGSGKDGNARLAVCGNDAARPGQELARCRSRSQGLARLWAMDMLYVMRLFKVRARRIGRAGMERIYHIGDAASSNPSLRPP